MKPWLLAFVVVFLAVFPATAKAQVVASLKSAATGAAKSGARAMAKTPKPLAAIRRGAAPGAAAAGFVGAEERVVAAEVSALGSADDGAAAAAKAPNSTLQRLREKAVDQAEGDAKVWAIEKAQESLGPDNGASGGFSGAGYVITAVGLAVGMWALVRRKRPQ
jgi:hypothetical protein